MILSLKYDSFPHPALAGRVTIITTAITTTTR
jgi:hypothetical protein